MQFEITFKNQKEKKYVSVILFFVIVHGLFFIYLTLGETWQTGMWGLIIIALYTAYRFLIANVRKQKFSYGSGIFYFFAMLFSFFLSWPIFITELILSTLSSVLLQRRSIYFNSYLVELRARPYRRYKWDDLTNVILKDNILTLDFKNNKLLQAEIEPANINEEAFNIFAQQQLNKT